MYVRTFASTGSVLLLLLFPRALDTARKPLSTSTFSLLSDSVEADRRFVYTYGHQHRSVSYLYQLVLVYAASYIVPRVRASCSIDAPSAALAHTYGALAPAAIFSYDSRHRPRERMRRTHSLGEGAIADRGRFSSLPPEYERAAPPHVASEQLWSCGAAQ